MPTYAYRCKDCGHAFDAVQSFTDDPLTVCSACGGTLRKQYGSVGVTFKGSGFYRTDSRGGTTSSSSSAGATGGSSSSAGATSGSNSSSGAGATGGSSSSAGATGGSSSSSAS